MPEQTILPLIATFLSGGFVGTSRQKRARQRDFLAFMGRFRSEAERAPLALCCLGKKQTYGSHYVDPKEVCTAIDAVVDVFHFGGVITFSFANSPKWQYAATL